VMASSTDLRMEAMTRASGMEDVPDFPLDGLVDAVFVLPVMETWPVLVSPKRLCKSPRASW